MGHELLAGHATPTDRMAFLAARPSAAIGCHAAGLAAPLLAAAEKGLRRDGAAAPLAGLVQGGRALVEALVLVVVHDGRDVAVASPDLHCPRVRAQQCADLLKGEQSAAAQT